MKIKDSSSSLSSVFKRFIWDRSHQILSTDLSRFVKCPINDVLNVIENNTDNLLKNYDACFSIRTDKYKILIAILYSSMNSAGLSVSMKRILCLFKRKNWSDKKRESRITIGTFITTILKFLQPLNDNSNYETLFQESNETNSNFEFESAFENEDEALYEKQESFINSLLDIRGINEYQEIDKIDKKDEKILNYQICDVKTIIEDLFSKMKFSESILFDSLKIELELSCLKKKDYKKQIAFYCIKKAYNNHHILFPDKYVMDLLDIEQTKYNHNICVFIEKYHENL